MPQLQDRVYLDFNASTPLRPEARAAMIARLDETGNASSIHAEGRAARAAIEAARADIGRLAGVAADRVTFTSGATEAAALVLAPGLSGSAEGPVTGLLVGATEHPAIRHGHRFAPETVGTIPVTRDGLIDLDALDGRLRQGGPVVAAIQAANGETGVIQPIAAIAARVHAAGGLLVCDASQAAGRIACTPEALGADVVILSAHKIGGPPGVGAVVAVRDGLRFGAPLLRGGGQERGLRAGTENGPAIAGFGAAARVARGLGDIAAVAALRDDLERRLRALHPDIVIIGSAAPRLPNTTAFAIPGLASETLLIGLDLAGVAVSTGSACSSGKVARSDVLEAMGLDPHLKSGMLRVSLGWSSTAGDVARFVAAFEGVMHRMHRSPERGRRLNKNARAWHMPRRDRRPHEGPTDHGVQ